MGGSSVWEYRDWHVSWFSVISLWTQGHSHPEGVSLTNQSQVENGDSRQSNPLLLLFWFLQHGAAILRVRPWSAMGVCLLLMVWMPVSAMGILGWIWPADLRDRCWYPRVASCLSISFQIWLILRLWYLLKTKGPILLSYSFVWLLSFSPAFSCSAVSWLRPECPSPGFSETEGTYSVFPIWKPFLRWKGTSGTGFVVLCSSEASVTWLLTDHSSVPRVLSMLSLKLRHLHNEDRKK